jgi:ABC-type transport system involved in multi-copper enzyme maturation permease subunit
MILGPVFWMEMRTASRRARHYATRAFFVSVIFTIIFAAWYSFQVHRGGRFSAPAGNGVWMPLKPHELPQLGHNIFSAYSVAQFLVVVLLAPLYTAGAIAADRERRVLEMLFTTDLRNIELVASKFLVRAIHLCALVISGLPVMFLCLLLGGVAAEDLIATSILTISTVLFVSSLGLLISIGSRRAYGAIIILYLILLIAWLALPVIAAFVGITNAAPVANLTTWICLAIISLNPMLVLMSVVIDGFGAGIWTDAPWVCAISYGAVTFALMAINIIVIRRFGLWASRERVVRDRKQHRERRTRRVWSNPVAWREVKTIAIHRRMRWARLLCLIFCVLLSALLWVGWIADWLNGRRALGMDLDGVSGMISCMATVAWVLMSLQGAVSFSHEREHLTLDALLTAPIAGVQILLGKLQGILRSSAFALAFPIALTLLAWSHGVTSGRAAVLSVVLIVLVGLFAACLGLACSVRLGSSGKACGLAAGIMLVLCVAIPISAHALLPYGQQYSWIHVRLISPSLSLSWAVYDEDSPGYRLNRYNGWTQYQWPKRFSKAVGHLLFEQLIAVVLIGWSVLYIESTCRVRQRFFSVAPSPGKGEAEANDPSFAGRDWHALDIRLNSKQ